MPAARRAERLARLEWRGPRARTRTPAITAEQRASDFRIVDVGVREPRPGEVVVRNTWTSVDPGLRLRLARLRRRRGRGARPRRARRRSLLPARRTRTGRGLRPYGRACRPPAGRGRARRDRRLLRLRGRGPDNLFQATANNLTLRGFLGSSYLHRMDDVVREVSGWLAAGRLRYRETVVGGLECAPEALARTLAGERIGKTLVRIRRA